MRIAVVGGGSIGLLTAARLALAGHSVAIVTRSEEQANQLRRRGLTIRTRDGQERTVQVQAVGSSARWPRADVALLAVKQPDLPAVCPRLRELGPDVRVIAMQNGMGHRERLLETVPSERLYFAVNTEGARRLTSTAVEHTGRGTLRIGPWERQVTEDPVLASFVERAQAADIPAERVEEVAPLAWRKLLANACINPLTALWEVTNGELLASAHALSLMRRMFDQAAELARREGQKIGEVDWEEILAICRNTSRNHSSMLQDLWSGKPTEIEAINGYVARTGRAHGLDVSTHELVRRAVLLKTSLGQWKGEAFRDRAE